MPPPRWRRGTRGGGVVELWAEDVTRGYRVDVAEGRRTGYLAQPPRARPASTPCGPTSPGCGCRCRLRHRSHRTRATSRRRAPRTTRPRRRWRTCTRRSRAGTAGACRRHGRATGSACARWSRRLTPPPSHPVSSYLWRWSSGRPVAACPASASAAPTGCARGSSTWPAVRPARRPGPEPRHALRDVLPLGAGAGSRRRPPPPVHGGGVPAPHGDPVHAGCRSVGVRGAATRGRAARTPPGRPRLPRRERAAPRRFHRFTAARRAARSLRRLGPRVVVRGRTRHGLRHRVQVRGHVPVVRRCRDADRREGPPQARPAGARRERRARRPRQPAGAGRVRASRRRPAHAAVPA